MSLYIVLIAGFGVLVLLTAWLPMLLKELPLSLPIACTAFGAAIFGLALPGTDVSPITAPEFYERLCEVVVVVALTGPGLTLARRCGSAAAGRDARGTVARQPGATVELAAVGSAREHRPLGVDGLPRETGTDAGRHRGR